MDVEEFIGKSVYYGAHGRYLWGENDKGECQMIGEIRGWAAIRNMFQSDADAECYQDELGEWIADAINQKLNR